MVILFIILNTINICNKYINLDLLNTFNLNFNFFLKKKNY